MPGQLINIVVVGTLGLWCGITCNLLVEARVCVRKKVLGFSFQIMISWDGTIDSL